MPQLCFKSSTFWCCVFLCFLSSAKLSAQAYETQQSANVIATIQAYKEQIVRSKQAGKWQEACALALAKAEGYYDLAMIEAFRFATDSAQVYAQHLPEVPLDLLLSIRLNEARYVNFYVNPEKALGILKTVEDMALQHQADLPYLYYETIATTYRNLTDNQAEVIQRFERAKTMLKAHGLQGTIYEARLYRSIGNAYLDRLNPQTPEYLKAALANYTLALTLFSTPELRFHPVRLQLIVLRGLAYYVAGKNVAADLEFQNFFVEFDEMMRNKLPVANVMASYLNTVNYSTWNNLEQAHDIGDLELEKQIRRVKKGITYYVEYAAKNANLEANIFLNTYHYAPYSSIAALFAKKFEATGATYYIDSVLFYAEMNKMNLLNSTVPNDEFRNVLQEVLAERALLYIEDISYADKEQFLVTFLSQSKKITKLIDDVYWMSNLNVEVPQLSDAAYKQITHRIYKTFVQPFEAYLSAGQRLAVIPAAGLQYFSFEALVVDSVAAFHENPFLWQKYAITQHPSLMVMRKRNAVQHRDRIVGITPNYRQRGFSDIRFTQDLFKKYLTQPAGALPLLQQIDSDVLLIAAHAYSHADEISKNYLALESVDVSIAALDTFDIHTSLAILAMCNASTGKRVTSTGHYSLTTAFLRQGTHACVGSLWSIDDYATSQILSGFFENLNAGLPKDIALEKAKKSFLRNAQSKDFYHPLYWAGLHAVGDLAPLPTQLRPQETVAQVWFQRLVYFLVPILLLLEVVLLRLRNNPEA